MVFKRKSTNTNQSTKEQESASTSSPIRKSLRIAAGNKKKSK